MSLYESAFRSLLFRLTPDHAHAVAQAALRQTSLWRALSALQGLNVEDPRLATRFAGVDLPNPVGIAAGLDKDGDVLAALALLGFGFVTFGSVMPEPRFGNPLPRLARYPQSRSMADSMGLPSKGLAHAVARAAAHERRAPLFANVGGFSADAIAAGFLALEPHVDGIEISLLCPNVSREGFDELKLLDEILSRIATRRKPAIVRVPNDVAASAERLPRLVAACIAGGIAGIKIGGGRAVSEPSLGAKSGTLHGRAIFEAALANVTRAARHAGGRLSIKGNGGVFSADDVIAMLRAGADCVDLYSGFIYEGWTIARDINRVLVRRLNATGASSLKALADGAAVHDGSTKRSM